MPQSTVHTVSLPTNEELQKFDLYCYVYNKPCSHSHTCYKFAGIRCEDSSPVIIQSMYYKAKNPTPIVTQPQHMIIAD